MKNQSKNLIKYLSENGLVDSGDEASIAASKVAYRREYKRNWKKNLKKSKELRPTFTTAEFEGIVARAKIYSLNPTSYAREVIISAQGDTDLIPRKDELIYILQAVSMAEIALTKDSKSTEARSLLQQAEEMLLTYLNIKSRNDR